MNPLRIGAACALLSVMLAAPLRAGANPADYVLTPNVVQGEREIDFKFGSASMRDADALHAASLGLGYSPTAWWFTEVYAKYQRQGGPTHADAVEWENRFMLTEPGQHPVDVGALLEIERPRDHAEGWELRWGPLLQADAGPWQLNANLLLQRHYGSATPSQTLMQYQLQAKYRYSRPLDFGVQAFGEFGPWRHFSLGSEQTHLIGPALFGQIALQGREKLVWNAGLLFGTTHASADRTLRAQVEYEF